MYMPNSNQIFTPTDALHTMVEVDGVSIPSFHFDLSSLGNSTSEVTHGVELRLHKSHVSSGSSDEEFLVSLYDVHSEFVVRLLQRQVNRVEGVGGAGVGRDDRGGGARGSRRGAEWLTYDVGRSVQEARHARHSPYVRFAVRVQRKSAATAAPLSRDTSLPEAVTISSADIVNQPTLTVYAETQRSFAKRRSKRAVRNGKRRSKSSRGQGRGGANKGRGRRRQRRKGKKSANHKCKRRPLYVSFADVGWKDWIMAPSGYDAFYCSGRCKGFLANHMNATNHAIVRSLVHSVRIDTPVLEPCCVPTQLAPLTLLYTERGDSGTSNSVLKIYDDMIVKSCGCR